MGATAGTGSTSEDGAGSRNKYLVLTAMIFAVSMTFIDMTIVSIAIPEIQKELSLSQTGVQWVINAYLLALAALFAFGGRLSDIAGHRKMVLVGVVVFAVASALNGLAPQGSLAEAWLITFRLIQGAGAAIMFPAALAIVVKAFPLDERGRAMAVFFGVAGGLTAVGPLAGGYLSEWTWRAIFWVNVPVAVIAVVLTLLAKPIDTYRKDRMDVPGLVLIASGMGLSVLGLQQSSSWGWSNPATWASIVVGLALLVVFAFYELRVTSPLIQMRIFKVRAFLVENMALFVAMITFIPLFFFASVYAQVALGQSASEAGLYLLVFFIGFAPGAQVGGQILDRVGAKPAVVVGSLVAAVGLALWSARMTDLSLGAQWPFIVIAGLGLGVMVGPANTDAINRAPRTSYGEATGVTQTVRNYGSSLGLAVLGTVLISVNRSNIESSLAGFGVPVAQADQIAQSLSQSGGGDTSSLTGQLPPAQAQQVIDAVQLDFAQACQVVFYAMAATMAVAAVVAAIGLQRGRQELVPGGPGTPATPAGG